MRVHLKSGEPTDIPEELCTDVVSGLVVHPLVDGRGGVTTTWHTLSHRSSGLQVPGPDGSPRRYYATQEGARMECRRTGLDRVDWTQPAQDLVQDPLFVHAVRVV